MKRDRPPEGVLNGCPTGKRAYPDRPAARAKALKHRQWYGDHLRPYRCPTCDAFHIGHLPAAVLRGDVSAREHYGDTG